MVGVLLVAPGFINWTPYRDTFAAQLSRSLARPVAVEGDVAFAILPRPTLSATQVRVGDDTTDETLTVETLRARLAFAPLLRGAFHFRALRLEGLAGRVTLDPSWTPFAASGSIETSESPGDDTFQVHVERIEIAGGGVMLRDAAGDTIARVSDIDIFAQLDGRDSYQAAGNLTLGGVLLALESRIGTAGADGARGVSVSLGLRQSDATLRASGRLALSPRRFSGEVSVSGQRVDALMPALGLSPWETSSAALQKPFTATAKAQIDDKGVLLSGLAMDLGGTRATGQADWRAARTPHLKVALVFAPVTLEDWALSSQTPSAPATTPNSASAPSLPSATAPSTWSADIVLRLPALSYQGHALRDGRFTATFADGHLKIPEVAVTLPGTTRATGFGLVDLTRARAVLDGIVELQTFDARGLFAALGADVGQVPPGRLGIASFRAAVQGTGSRINFNDIAATVDTARLAGSLTFAGGARPFVGADLRIENVNLDSYLAATPRAAHPARSVAKPDVYGVAPTGTAFTGLGAFDADIVVQAEGITAGGLPGGRLGLDVGLKDGTLAIRTASFEGIAGVTAWASGAVGGFGTALKFDNVQFDFAGDDLARLAETLRWESLATFAGLSPVSLTGTLNGGAMQAELAATAKAADMTARLTGQIMDFEQAPRFAGAIEVAHPRFGAFMKSVSGAWPENMRDPGAFALRFRVAQEPKKTTISDFALSVGKDRMTGHAEVLLGDARPRVTATLSDIALDLDHLLPPQPDTQEASASEARAVPSPAAGFAFLRGWDGEISVSGPAFSARGFAVQDFAARLVAADDAVELADWQGRVFGAPGELALRVTSGPVAGLQGQIAVKQGEFRAFAAAVNGGRTNLKTGGTVDFVASFSAQGATADALLGSLSGAGTLTVTATETGGGAAAGLFGPLTAASQLNGGGTGTPITFSTRLNATAGTLTFKDATVSSRGYTGTFTGAIDMPRGQVDLVGTLVPRKAGEERLPITIKGALARPNIKLLPSDS